MKLELNDLKKRWQSRAALAITIESGRIVVDLVRSEEGVGRVAQSLTLPVGADAMIADPERAGLELAAQLETEGIRERRCVVCIPLNWALTTSTDVPPVSAEDLRGYLELRAEAEFPISLPDLRLAHCAYTLPDGKQRATLAAIPAKRMEAVEKMLASASCRAVSISLGLDACLPKAGAPAGLHFLANGTHVDLIIAAGGGIAALRSLATPAKDGAANFDSSSFSREVRITLGGLPDPVRTQLGTARFSGSAAAESLRLQLQPQLERMGIASSPQIGPGEGSAHHLGRAIEAAESYLRQQPVAFEFVTPEASRWQAMFEKFDSRRRRWMIAAGAGFVVLPILVFAVRSKMESSLEAEWKSMQTNVGQLESLQQKIRQFRPWFEPAPRSLQLLEGLMAAFPEQGNVWAKSIQLTEGGKVTCSGFARSQTAFAAFLDALRAHKDVTEVQIQQVRGENPVQFSIVYKWEARDAN